MATVKLDPAKGIQIPNLTTTERNAISSPETGAIIWNTTTSEINQYNGSAWEITYTPVAGITSSADATAITIDSSENVGIGVTPASWYTGGKALQINSSSLFAEGDVGNSLLHNAYINSGGSAWIYNTNGYATKHTQQTGTHTFSVAPSGSAGGTVTWNNALTIANNGQVTTGGDLIVGADVQLANGRGISFTNMPNASGMTSELLDDYEEGTFTATTTFSADTISSSNCLYTKIGRMVHCSMYFYATINTVNVNIGGLPFSPAKASTWTVGMGGSRYLEHFGRLDANSTNLVGTLSGTTGNVELYISVTYQTT